MKIKLLGDYYTCLGFDLAGLDTVVAEQREEVGQRFKESMEDEDLALLFITEKQAEFIRDAVEKQKMGGVLPLVVEIPDRQGWQQKGKVLDLINRVLSIKI